MTMEPLPCSKSLLFFSKVHEFKLCTERLHQCVALDLKFGIGVRQRNITHPSKAFLSVVRPSDFHSNARLERCAPSASPST